MDIKHAHTNLNYKQGYFAGTVYIKELSVPKVTETKASNGYLLDGAYMQAKHP